MDNQVVSSLKTTKTLPRRETKDAKKNNMLAIDSCNKVKISSYVDEKFVYTIM
jgi:hypothetical protein